MKLASSVLVSTLCWTARLTAASSARIFIHDPQSQQPGREAHSRSLEPVPARLVLAQRAGVEDYHSADISRPEVVEAINDYGVRTPLFGSAEKGAQNAFILLEGQGDAESISILDSYTSFELNPAPASPANRGLFVDLAKQSNPRDFLQLSDDDVYDLLKSTDFTSSAGNVFHIVESTEQLKQLVTKLVLAKKWSITALVTSSSGSSVTKGEQFQWGTYEMPGLQGPLRKRQQRQQNQEEPLTETQSFEPVQSFSAPVIAFANNTTPFRGILPACFSTLAACESTTRNCTGHGSCTRKYHDNTVGPSGGIDCWSCACKATKTGGRTTKWGGPACQKKDISIEFWLIVLFTVGMVFLIGFAVGTIWDMGQEDLPSVIGAGVSGPTARR